MDVYLTTRKQFGAKKFWSEKLEADLMRASLFRIARRGDLKKKMRKPYQEYQRKWIPKPNWMLGETAENPIDTSARKTWSAMWPSLAMTMIFVLGYYLTERGISLREWLSRVRLPSIWSIVDGGEWTDDPNAKDWKAKK